MKTTQCYFRTTLFTLPILFICVTSSSQHTLTGSWEGTFMGDFNTIVRLNGPGDSGDPGNSGNIQMFSNGTMIQDDELSAISLEGDEFTFYIEAKETTFRGTLSDDGTEISGNFLFPDRSLHPLILHKIAGDGAGNGTPTAEFNSVRSRIYQGNELESDLLFLVQQLKANHPQLYSYRSESGFEKAVNAVKDSIGDGSTLEAFYRLIAPLVASVQCSHTGARLPSSYRQLLQESGNYFPLDLCFTDGKAFYLGSYNGQGTGPVPGDEIRSINGVPVHEIMEDICSMIPAEGGSVSTRRFEINKNFHEYFCLLDQSEIFTVDFATAGSTATFRFNACHYADLGKFPAHAGPESPLEYRFNEGDQTAYIRIATFGIRDMEGYMQRLDELFKKFQEQRVPYLVLDLRGNQGGHPIFAAQLLSYLTERPFTYFKRNPEISEFEPLYNPMQPDVNHFQGDLYVLVDGGCLSTTGHLIALLKEHTGAIFVGEEPGSTYSCNDFSIPVTLPHTGIEVNIPRTTFEIALEGMETVHAFAVDIPVRPTVNQVIQGTDAPLSVVERLIAEQAAP